ncbi:MAG TPA: DUF368 domain-containing protein [Clostridia bacterium]|nr:DUF368 domain-containing protein [Clostridia bacterium]
MEIIKNFIKGIITGIATLVPGVSGGTMAIILGIYDRLIHSVSSIFEDFKKNFLFLFQVGLGGVLGILLFSRLMESAMNTIPYIMQFLFIGIIIGGLPVLYGKSVSSGKGSIVDYIFLIAGFATVLLMTSEPQAIVNLATARGVLSYVFLVFAGIIIAVALVLPGISASFMLLALGMYSLTLNAINTINIPFLIPLGAGLAIGTFGTARAIEKLLQKYPRKTYMLIIGFVLGSLVEVFPGIPQGWQLPASIAVLLLGFAVIFWLGKKGLTD